ncbi:MAG: cell division protein FtsQ/DivIB [Marinosulfonomonas sp.]
MRAIRQNQAPRERRDPAPSRASYKMHRLWLTPIFRRLLRVGLPVFLISLSVGWYFGKPENRQALHDKVAEMRRSIEVRPEFMVKLMAIDGASLFVAEGIREINPIDFPISSFDLDLDDMKNKIAELDAVAKVDLRIRSGGILQVQITEREPVVVWRSGEGLELLDENGHRVAAVGSRRDRADLPLLAGAGADEAVEEGLTILAAAGPVKDRVRGLVRIGERRWDLVLDRDQRIMLPEKAPIQALEQVMALEQATELLARDITVVDMRKKGRPTLRMASSAVAELRKIRDTKPGANQE